MNSTTALIVLAGALGGTVAVQETKKELLAQNKEQGVEIRAPRSKGSDQLWEAKANADGVHKGSAVLVRHVSDPFTVEVNVVRRGGDFMSDDMEASWPRPSVIGGKARDRFTASGDKGPSYTECKLVSEEPKAKLAGLPGAGYSHRILLTDRDGAQRELIEYFIICSDVLYRVTVSFTKESHDQHWAGEGQFILQNIRRCKIEK